MNLTLHISHLKKIENNILKLQKKSEIKCTCRYNTVEIFG
jgi:hypothetical protein